MRFEYAGEAPEGVVRPCDRRWRWRVYNPWTGRWWTFMFGLRDHQWAAMAAGWRKWGGPSATKVPEGGG